MILLGLEIFLLLGVGSLIYEMCKEKKNNLEIPPPNYNDDPPPYQN